MTKLLQNKASNVQNRYKMNVKIYMKLEGNLIDKSLFQSLTLNNNDISTPAHIRPLQTGSAVVLSRLRCLHSNECEGAINHLTTSGGGSGRRVASRPLPLEHWTTTHSTRQGDRAGERDILTSHGEVGGSREGDL